MMLSHLIFTRRLRDCYKTGVRIVLALGVIGMAFGVTPPSQTVDLPSDIFAGRIAPPYWSKGFLLIKDHDATTQPQRPHFKVYEQSGRQVSQVRLSFPNANAVYSEDAVVIDGLGNMVVSGSTWSHDAQFAAFLAWIDNRGEIKKVVRTNPFLARHICIASDGSIWAFGVNAENIRSDHEVIQRFSKEGLLLGKSILRSSFKSGSHPAMISGKLGGAFIRASGDRVGVFSGAGEEWLEFGLDGQLLGRWSVKAPVALRRDGLPGVLRAAALAWTTSNSVFVWMDAGTNGGLHELDRSQSRWVRVVNGPDEYIGISGTKDDQIVMRALYNGSTTRYGWFPVASRFGLAALSSEETPGQVQ